MSVDPKSSYYDAGGIETIDVIKAKMSKEMFIGWCLGNAIKYLCRVNFKHETMDRDIEKAMTYLTAIKIVLAEE